jgi:hypothetical protein
VLHSVAKGQAKFRHDMSSALHTVHGCVNHHMLHSSSQPHGMHDSNPAGHWEACKCLGSMMQGSATAKALPTPETSAEPLSMFLSMCRAQYNARSPSRPCQHQDSTTSWHDSCLQTLAGQVSTHTLSVLAKHGHFDESSTRCSTCQAMV